MLKSLLLNKICLSMQYNYSDLYFWLQISWMKHKLPSDHNKESIKNCLEETFLNRRQWIVDSGPTISEIFERYPRLLDYHGEMVNLNSAF